MSDLPTDNFRRVLVIDDHEPIHSDFEKILVVTESCSELDKLDAELFGGDLSDSNNEYSGFDLTHAMQGKDGLKILQGKREDGDSFGCAFVDMRMPPGWDGVETIENLWKEDPNLQVVICTAYSDHSWDDVTKRLGEANNLLILKKPFDEIEVVQLATSLCEKRRLLELSQQRLDNLEHTVGEQAAELESAHANAEKLIQSLSSLLISLDEEGNVSRWNPMATRILGIEHEDAVGKTFADLDIDWEDRNEVIEMISKSDPETQCSGEVRLKDECGVSKTIDIRICSIGEKSDRAAKLIIGTDVTERKSLQVQLNQAQRLEAVGQLAAGVAHEINTPMQYIGDNVRYVAKSIKRIQHLVDILPSFIDESVPDETVLELRQSHYGSVKSRQVKSSIEQIPEALSDSIVGVETVSKIVAAMKELSHPGGDEKANVGINHLLESAITVAKNEWKYVAEIETQFSDSLPDVPAFASELSQAFINIIVNAAHAIGDRVGEGRFDRGKITIATDFDSDSAIIKIRDNGGGIPEEFRERVFEPFFTTKEVGKGTGQGLAIAHSVIVNKHGGSIDIHVLKGEGTTFDIRVPLTLTPDFQAETDPELNQEAMQ